MNKEIKIILEEHNSHKQGDCFEKLVRNILETQRYKVHSDINYTGMEIDLIAKHMDRQETIYVECKAKEKVTSDEIKKFIFSVQHKNAKLGLFIRTKELAHQAAGLVDELKNDPGKRYENLTFFEPEKVISLLQDSSLLIRPKIADEQIVGKEILAVTYLGDFYIYIIRESFAAVPSKAIIINANTGNQDTNPEQNEMLKAHLSEIANLEFINIKETEMPINYHQSSISIKPDEIESISELQESENWFDYLPASSQHFVGRDKIKADLLQFFSKVLQKNTNRRIFYLTGKSGWGKSSLIAEIRGRTKNKYYKKRFYTLAIDSRSALSSNFVALAFDKLLKKAFSDGFLNQTLFSKNISFNSSFDLLSSDEIREFLRVLEEEGKVLILVFDQFEDVFRKEGHFEVFYKFLTDVTDFEGNLIVGFSWKTEILIPSENPAYHYWQQSREQGEHFTVPEFGSKETKLLIGQLESSIGKINDDLKRRLIESSQGFPWLLKKLCIHVYDQINSGKSKQELIEENLNIAHLFNKDIESLTDAESKNLRYIAQRAHEGNFFETSEVNDLISENIINSLRDDKRLIIRSGLNYNIYWDIFRDYLVTGKVPQIGESYIIRSSLNSCLDIYMLFYDKLKLSSSEIQTLLTKNITTPSIENCIIDLRSLGILKKVETSDSFELTKSIQKVSIEYFQNYITEKIKFNTVYLKARNLRGQVSSDNIIVILKEVFKGYSYQEGTWRVYANYFLNWFAFSDLDISKRILQTGKGRGRPVKFHTSIKEQRINSILRTTPKKMQQILLQLELQSLNSLAPKFTRDLALLDLIRYNDGRFLPTKDLIKIISSPIQLNKILAIKCVELKTIRIVSDYLMQSTNDITTKDIIRDCPEIFKSSLKKSSKIIYCSGILQWARFHKRMAR